MPSYCTVGLMNLNRSITPGIGGRYVCQLGKPRPFYTLEPKRTYKDERWFKREKQKRASSRPKPESRVF